MASVSERARDWTVTNNGEVAVRSVVLHSTKEEMEGRCGTKNGRGNGCRKAGAHLKEKATI